MRFSASSPQENLTLDEQYRGEKKGTLLTSLTYFFPFHPLKLQLPKKNPAYCFNKQDFYVLIISPPVGVTKKAIIE